MSAETHHAPAEIVYISGKQAEEVGFTKFSQRQAKLQGIHVLVLDRMRIKHDQTSRNEEAKAISELCAEITDLDLSNNLFETFDEIFDLCYLLPRLRSLTLDGNRFSVHASGRHVVLETLRTLSISQALLGSEEIRELATAFPALETLRSANNESTNWICPVLPSSLQTLDLSENQLHSLSHIRDLGQNCPNLRTLSLKNSLISEVGIKLDFPTTLEDLDLAYNAIDEWKFFNDLAALSRLRSLRVTGNPLYKHVVSADGKPLAAEDGYMLTIARLPQLQSLNYSKIAEKERLNAETYYLGQIAIELSTSAEGKEKAVLARHPRYRDLCAEYGEPTIERKARADEVDPRSLAARLVSVMFVLEDGSLPDGKQRTWTTELPKSFDVYAILGTVGKELDVSPMTLALVLETGERDPVARDSGYAGPEWWDSDDEEVDTDADKEDWTIREIELVPGTRVLGTYVEGREARMKVKHV